MEPKEYTSGVDWGYDPEFMDSVRTSEKIKAELWWRENGDLVGAIAFLVAVLMFSLFVYALLS